jgi:ABC-type phosphate transport system substrate-binding protein
VSPLNTTTYGGLGYGSSPNQLIGTQVLSAYPGSSATANPVAFNLSGGDPFTGQPVKAYTTIPVGAAPIVFIINRTNPNGLGKSGVFTNIQLPNVQKIYNGTECDSNAFGASNPPPNVPVTAVLREPLSGTMNTTEFTNFRLASTSNNSQEVGVNPGAGGNNNPLNKPCTSGGGRRVRAIGTGEVVGSWVLNTQDSLGYTFFSFGNVSKIAGTASFGYLKLNGVDPIHTSYTNGILPTCTAPCPATARDHLPQPPQRYLPFVVRSARRH